MSQTSSPPIPASGVAPLAHLGVIRVEGTDAAAFLHGQLTQDFSLLGLAEARLAAYCSAKGRMLASFVGFKRTPDDILLLCSRDLLAPTLKRLSMFVLRAKARVSDASEAFVLAGLVGETVPAALPPTAWSLWREGEACVVRLPAAEGTARALWVAPAGHSAPTGPSLAPETWDWLAVRSGVATLTQPVVEAFVPQMLNYESVGGVNFKKGCYPGQEVVARSQFRGTLKRRAFIAHADAPLAAGQEVFLDSEPEQPCGTVVQAAPRPGGGFDAIVSLQLSASSQPGLRAGGAQGPALALLPLPYPLLEDI
ncbi:folate-binding protein [Hydrogenophaga sp.]|uniref:CAF17-like 4Fe-4S cluster assembly/insertion protein YgfZ n=1 Tax=Hydrogenophaga sp. TaxID=1904254 RepID=UPI0026154A41|nr:folate-binding protein [Hydrogenophaga sp.]MCW5652427.1 folate-binding protein YgfZ [Hydrogenophaga sp.]